MRNALYEQLQDLPVAFHDRWPSGQLLSRAVSDLSLIRRWLSFGIVLLVVNVVTIVGRFRHPDRLELDPRPDLPGLLDPAVDLRLRLREASTRSIARRSQDQAGDLATAVEESVHGIRVLKAFGRGKHALKSFESQAEQLRGTEIEKAKAIAGIWLWLLLVPDVAFGICLVVGVWLASQGAAVGRRAGGVLRHRDRAAVPDRVDRLPALDDVRHAHRGRPLLRGDGRGQHDHRPGRAEDDHRPAGRARLRRRALPLPGLAGALPRPARRHRPDASSRARRWRWSA